MQQTSRLDQFSSFPSPRRGLSLRLFAALSADGATPRRAHAWTIGGDVSRPVSAVSPTDREAFPRETTRADRVAFGVTVARLRGQDPAEPRGKGDESPRRHHGSSPVRNRAE